MNPLTFVVLGIAVAAAYFPVATIILMWTVVGAATIYYIFHLMTLVTGVTKVDIVHLTSQERPKLYSNLVLVLVWCFSLMTLWFLGAPMLVVGYAAPYVALITYSVIFQWLVYFNILEVTPFDD